MVVFLTELDTNYIFFVLAFSDELIHLHLQVLVETCQMLHEALDQAKLGSQARVEEVRLAYLQARCTALIGKQE